MSTRLSRAESTQANREAVVTAARAEFERHGYHGASLDSISEAAGFSKGVVYSQFGSKDALFLAVLEASIDKRRAEMEAAFDWFTGPQDLPRVLEFAFEQGTATADWQAALLEFRVHAWRNPGLNASYAEIHERSLGNVRAFIERTHQRGGLQPPEDSRLLASASMAVGLGFLVELMVQPELDMSKLLAAVGLGADATADAPGGVTR